MWPVKWELHTYVCYYIGVYQHTQRNNKYSLWNLINDGNNVKSECSQQKYDRDDDRDNQRKDDEGIT